ncbi:MAG: dTDP-4-dehydrorhamnose 3,5-epimerase [Pseudomonadota bacterium]
MVLPEARELHLKGAYVLTPRRYGDDRGFFAETWNRRALAEVGIDVDFVQDNHSLSRQKGTVRGLHYQVPPHGQAKLIRCGRGRLIDVVVDIRKGSPTFGQHDAVELSAENGVQVFIPEGFAHGFVTREDDTEICYKCSGYYAPGADRSVRFDDPALGIDWPITRADAVLSDKDADALPLAEHTLFTWDAT